MRHRKTVMSALIVAGLALGGVWIGAKWSGSQSSAAAPILALQVGAAGAGGIALDLTVSGRPFLGLALTPHGPELRLR